MKSQAISDIHHYLSKRFDPKPCNDVELSCDQFCKVPHHSEVMHSRRRASTTSPPPHHALTTKCHARHAKSMQEVPRHVTSLPLSAPLYFDLNSHFKLHEFYCVVVCHQGSNQEDATQNSCENLRKIVLEPHSMNQPQSSNWCDKVDGFQPKRIK